MSHSDMDEDEFADMISSPAPEESEGEEADRLHVCSNFNLVLDSQLSRRAQGLKKVFNKRAGGGGGGTMFIQFPKEK